MPIFWGAILPGDWSGRPGLHVHRDHRLAQIHMRLKAVVAELQAKLIFALGAKTAVALVAGRDFLMFCVFAGVNLGMDFDHWKNSPQYTHGKRLATSTH